MTTRCNPPLGIECAFPAVETVRLSASFLPPAEHEPRGLCELHLVLLRAAGFELARVVDVDPLEGWAPGEITEAYGR